MYNNNVHFKSLYTTLLIIQLIFYGIITYQKTFKENNFCLGTLQTPVEKIYIFFLRTVGYKSDTLTSLKGDNKMELTSDIHTY